MKFISTKAHAFLDYFTGITLIASPWLFNFNNNGIESFAPIFLGSTLILYSLFTNYEWSINKAMSLSLHLVIDVLSGIVLALSPWIFGFSDEVFLPHLIIGIFEVIVAVFTKNTPYYEGNLTHNVQV